MSAQLPIDWNAVTTAPSAIQARRSGRQRVVSTVSTRMLAYRDRVRVWPSTDHEYAERWLGGLHFLSVANAIRGDWKAWAEHHGRPCPVVAVSRERKDWGSGSPTTRVRWGWQEAGS